MMYWNRIVVAALLSGSMAVPAVAKTHARRGPTSPAKSSSHKHKTTAKKKKSPPGPRGIGDDRATEIQQALIKSGYLNGEPSGHWDSDTQAAMRKLQSDNGWQTKLIPDSRALIKLGLGPHNAPAPAQSPQPLASSVAPASATQAAVSPVQTSAAPAADPATYSSEIASKNR